MNMNQPLLLTVNWHLVSLVNVFVALHNYVDEETISNVSRSLTQESADFLVKYFTDLNNVCVANTIRDARRKP